MAYQYKSGRRNLKIEDKLQEICALFLWRDTDLEWYHPSPNVYRGALALFAPPEYCRKVGAAAKRKGVRGGVPDIFIMDTPPAFPDKKGVYIELKRQGGSLSKCQKQFKKVAEAKGYLFFVAIGNSLEPLQDILHQCGYLIRES